MRKLYNSKAFKILEISIFYILIPFLVENKVFGEGQLNKVVPLMTIFLIFLALLLHDPSFENKRLIKLRPYNWKGAAIRFLIIGLFATAYTRIFHPDLPFHFLQEKPQNFLLFLILYPLISVIPQEIIYRVYFFHRYEGLFRNGKALAALNVALFAFLHFIYDNYIAVAGAAIVGAIFVLNYLRTRSLINVAIEHYAYGVLTFVIGLGKYVK